MEFGWTNTRRALEAYGQRLIDKYRDNLKEGDSFATGNLYNNLSYEVKILETRFEVVISLEDYWRYVEDGRRAGGKMPPITAIENWIKAKPVIPRMDSRGRTPTVRQLAFLIARSISIKGIEPKKPFQRAYDSLLDGLYAELREAVAADAKNYVISAISYKRS